ncbi:hypothetical protein WOLCODRAFT_147202 [Wolfiporia cocos MD-104 SS10]|uniref:Cytochrome P450 n=1 Tax=Wolfiporia cocos (strain MD-104) TaxID=742152 RepID=A0A2H3J615_WOLCO|nr:hypothetical protein WOLCODRAFT_147202 [Wolfiporia cocos MD-104 SS10]
MLYISDPAALDTILLKDPANFEEGSSYMNANILMFGPGISSVSGEQHRKQRRMLTSAFSATQMREALPTIRETAARLHTALASRVSDTPREVDILGWLSRTTLENIGQAGLGYSFDSLIEDERDEFGKIVNMVFPTIQEMFVFRPFLPYIFSFGTPGLRRRLVESLWFIGLIKRLQNVADAMDTMSSYIYRAKISTLYQNKDFRDYVMGNKNIMSTLLRATTDTSGSVGMSDAEVISQISIVIAAAVDTTATTLSRILQLLAQYEDYQERLRTELQAYKLDELTYDELIKIPLMDAMYKETLRLYPAANQLTREVQKDTVLPLHQPINGQDGRTITEIPVPAGSEVIVGILGCNTSRYIWGDDALEWKPERWLSPLPDSVINAPIPGVYSSLMTFVGGKRSCVGLKFAELSIKILLATLIPHFTFGLTGKPIVWNLATVLYPTMDEDSVKPEMLLTVAKSRQASGNDKASK